MCILVVKPCMLASFQDRGRTGYQHLGVPVGGAMDSRAHRLANLLVGNDENEATLEITLTGPTLRFDAPACIAICGAQLNRSEEHTSELQSLMRISYAVFCLKKKTKQNNTKNTPLKEYK